MTEIAQETLLRSLFMVLDEAFEGPSDPRGTWFTSDAPGSGVLGTLRELTAEEASQAPAPGRPSAAAHANHVRFGLDVSARFLRGEMPDADWKESWAVQTVDDAAWTALQDELGDGYRALRQVVEGRADWDWLGLAAAIGAVAHVAYHLGALRQVSLAVRGRQAAETAGSA